MEEFTYNTIIGLVVGFFIGALIGFFVLFYSIDNDQEEKDCVEFYKKYNYVTDKCEVYKDKLVNINE